METTDSTFDFMGGEFATDTAPPIYAGFWIRVAAAIIDSFVLMIPNWILSMAFAGSIALTDIDTAEINPLALAATFSTYILASSLLAILYKSVMESSSWQATLGKKAFNLKVATELRERISFLRALSRTLLPYLSFLLLVLGFFVAFFLIPLVLASTFILVAFTSKKQGLHDLIAKTVVVKKKG